MLGNEGQAAKLTQMINAGSKANTAAATSAWIDVREYEGDLLLLLSIGAVTGSITPTLEDATDGAGAGAAAVVPNEGAFAAGAVNTPQKRTIGAGAVRGWIRFVGTIVTGPVDVAVALLARPKYT